VLSSISTEAVDLPVSRKEYLALLLSFFFYRFHLTTHVTPVTRLVVATQVAEKTVQLNIRNAPEELVRRAKVQAAAEGISLREFVIRAITRALGKFDVTPLMREAIESDRRLK
jgi:plasmid stability protein